MELTEAVSRQFLKLHIPGTDMAKAILEAVLKNEQDLYHWDDNYVKEHYEQCSNCLELLMVITELWISARGHSFAQG